jgi:hypothetical protein
MLWKYFSGMESRIQSIQSIARQAAQRSLTRPDLQEKRFVRLLVDIIIINHLVISMVTLALLQLTFNGWLQVLIVICAFLFLLLLSIVILKAYSYFKYALGVI